MKLGMSQAKLWMQPVEVTMEPLKKDAINTIANLPDDVSDMEEIMYRLYVLENIRRGQADAEKGNTTSAEQILRDIQTW